MGSTLVRIAAFLLRREREEKALPNFIDEIAGKADAKFAQELRNCLCNETEQCARVLAMGLGQVFPLQIISDSALSNEYERPSLRGARITHSLMTTGSATLYSRPLPLPVAH